MSLIHLPQTKWGSGTGRQVILKGDFAEIEQAVLEAFELTRGPGLEFVDSATVRVNATADCKARVMMCGLSFPFDPGPLGGWGPKRWPLPGERRGDEPQSGHRRKSLGQREVQPVVRRICSGRGQRQPYFP